MCERCFDLCSPPSLPEKIKESYRSRHGGGWNISKEGKIVSKIKHIRFVYQDGEDEGQFWMGVEKLEENGRTEYRFCYWADRKRGKGWHWGQFSPMFRENTLNKVISLLPSLQSQE